MQTFSAGSFDIPPSHVTPSLGKVSRGRPNRIASRLQTPIKPRPPEPQVPGTFAFVAASSSTRQAPKVHAPADLVRIIFEGMDLSHPRGRPVTLSEGYLSHTTEVQCHTATEGEGVTQEREKDQGNSKLKMGQNRCAQACHVAPHDRKASGGLLAPKPPDGIRTILERRLNFPRTGPGFLRTKSESVLNSV